jgi:hypothetical protein
MPPKRAASNLSPGTVSSPSSSSAGTVSSATKELQNAALREGFAEYQATIRKHKESRTKNAVISLRQFCADLIAEDDRLQPLNAESLRCRFKRIIGGKSLEGKLAPSLDPVVPMGRTRIGMDPLQKLGFIQHINDNALGAAASRPALAAFNASIKQQNSGNAIRRPPSTLDMQYLEAELKLDHPEFIVSNSIPTNAGRHAAVKPVVLEKHYDDLQAHFDKKPLLQKQPGRILNYDESGLNSQAEKQAGDHTAYTTSEIIKLCRGRQTLRTMSMGDGTGNVTCIPFSLADGVLLGLAFVGAAPNAASRPNYAAPASFTYKATHGGASFLPGIPENIFDVDPLAPWKAFCRVFATPSGSVDSGLVDLMLCDWIFPKWRALYPEGCVYFILFHSFVRYSCAVPCSWCATRPTSTILR